MKITRVEPILYKMPLVLDGPVPMSSGVYVDVPILRMADKFVGPQGEEYKSLPTAKQLAEKYAR